MARTLTELLNAKLQEAETYEDRSLALQRDVLTLLKSDEAADCQSISQTFEDLRETIRVFKFEITNPRITLATTGTTSGGKSSLVNLLCGANIMPVAVQEMSAGTVIIDHDPLVRSLTIPPVEGLDPEFCGDWIDLTDQVIQLRLTQLMDGYRRLREEGREPAAPRIHLRFPTRIGMRPELAGLPDGFRLRIIDLPGFKHIADEHNRQVIQDEIRPALCLVTYNSEETDPVKQQILLDEVVDQVREIRGSPAKMLFILNRIDVFRRDADWESRTRGFVDTTMTRVRQSIATALPEYGEQAAVLRGQPLSTGPALFSHMARTSARDEAIEAMERIDNVYRFLMPEEAKDLPRRISHWAEHDYKRIADSVWGESHGAAFDETLRLHVRDNLPQLLLPHLLQSVADVAGACLTTVEQIVYAHVHSHKEKYQAECERLAEIKERLQELRRDSQRELLERLTFSSENDLIEELTDNARYLQQRYELNKDSLVPLHDWSTQLGNSIEQFLTSIHDAIKEDRRPTGYLIDLLPLQQQEEIGVALEKLRSSGYKAYAGDGGHVEARTSVEKERLKAINEAINSLSIVLAHTLKGVLDRTAEQEADRIQRALEVLIIGYANNLTIESQKVAPDLTSLSTIPSGVVRVKQGLFLTFVLSAGFPVYHNKEKVRTGDKTVLRRERTWYTLWIMTREVSEIQPIYEMRTFEQAIIPSVTEVFSNFIAQAKASRTEGEFMRWLQKQIDGFLADVGAYQENLLNEYREHLDRVQNSAKELQDSDVATWEEKMTLVTNLRVELKQLREVN
jgi:hypothetical protein